MQKNLQYLAIVMAISAVCTSSVQAGDAEEAPQRRTWGEYFSQKAAANNIFASKDSRKLASAQLKLGTLQMQQTRVEAEAQRQQERTNRQAEQLTELKRTQDAIKAANDRIVAQTKAARQLREQRILIRQGKAVPGIFKISVTDGGIKTKVGPKFLAYVNLQSKKQKVIDKAQEAAVAELTENAEARGEGPADADEVESLKNNIIAARDSKAVSVDFPVKYTKP